MSCWKLGVNTSEEMLLTASVSGELSALFSERLPHSITLLWNLITYIYSNHCAFFRTIVYWKSKDVDNILKGYKLNLQSAIGSKAPASLLNFYFKYTFCRKVSISIINQNVQSVQ